MGHADRLNEVLYRAFVTFAVAGCLKKAFFPIMRVLATEDDGHIPSEAYRVRAENSNAYNITGSSGVRHVASPRCYHGNVAHSMREKYERLREPQRAILDISQQIGYAFLARLRRYVTDWPSRLVTAIVLPVSRVL
jgi:hypothetical protein